MKLASFLAIFILLFGNEIILSTIFFGKRIVILSTILGRRVHSEEVTLNLKSGTEFVKFPTKFNSTEAAKEYVKRLAGTKLDEIAQEISKKLGGVVLQQTIKNEAYQNFTETKLEPGTYLYLTNSVIYYKNLVISFKKMPIPRAYFV